MRKFRSKVVLMATTVVTVLLLQGCSPEVGSKEWCTELKEKPKGEWTGNEAKDFTKHCIF